MLINFLPDLQRIIGEESDEETQVSRFKELKVTSCCYASITTPARTITINENDLQYKSRKALKYEYHDKAV